MEPRQALPQVSGHALEGREGGREGGGVGVVRSGVRHCDGSNII